MVSKTVCKGNKKKRGVKMRKLCFLMVVLCSVVLFSGICYADKGKHMEKDMGKVVKEFSVVKTIKPGKIYEKCLTLRPRQVFDYKFEASSPVYFNIHYHGEQGREYMIQKKAISSLEKTITEFQYKKAYQGFSKKAMLCMLWKNNTDAPVEVALDCVTSKK